VTGIIAGGGIPEGKGWKAWLKRALRLIFPGTGGRM